jgi:hypothetical protein
MQKLLIGLLVVGSLSFSAYVLTLAPSAPAVLTSQSTSVSSFSSASALNHDWGDIDIMGGKVTKVFSLSNSEDEALLLSGAVSSCMCTVAEFVLDDGTRSGDFGMHGGPDWSHMIDPGESFDVEVTFDPMAHGPSATGPISRTVNVISKVDRSSETLAYTRIDVRGDVLSEADYQTKYE